MKPFRRPVLLLLALFMPLAAVLWAVWGRDSAQPRPVLELPPGKGFPVELRLADGRTHRIDAPPERILPANAGVVDYVTRLVEPARVCALPEQAWGFSRLTEGASELSDGADWAGLPRFEGYTAEAVLGHRPDLVIIHGWQSIDTTTLLAANQVPVLEIPTPTSWQEIRRTLELLGRVLGAEQSAHRQLAELDRREAALAARAVDLGHRESPPRALSYSNLGTGGWAAGAGTTADVLFELCGVTNAAAEHGVQGHGRVDIEALLLMDPDLIVVGAHSEEGREDESPTGAWLAGEERLSSLGALESGAVITLPPRLYSSSSVELFDAAEHLMEALEARR